MHARRARLRPVVVRAVLAATLLAPTVRAAEAPAQTPALPAPEASDRYSLSAAVRPASDASRWSLDVDPRAVPWQGLPSCTIEVGRQALEAHAAVASGVFRARAGEPDVVLEVAIGAAEIVAGSMMARAEVEHVVTARAVSGKPISSFTLRGDAGILGAGCEGVERAFARAAASAAGRLPAAFDGSAEVKAWLSERGLVGRVPRTPWPARGRVVSFADLGAGYVRPAALGWAARLGVSGERAFAALSASRSGYALTARPAFLGGTSQRTELAILAVGAEVGLVRRWAREVEARLGLGVFWNTGNATMEYDLRSRSSRMRVDDRAAGASVFAALQSTTRPLTASGLRARGGVEVRGFFGGELSYGALAVEARPQLFASLTVGLEWPLAAPRVP